MNYSMNALLKCVLFENINENDISLLMEGIQFSIKCYNNGEIVALEDDPCDSLSIILSGDIEIHKPFPSGKVVTISHLTTGDVFAESLVFSNKKRYPANVISSSKSCIMDIPKSNLVQILSKNPKVLENFAGVLSKRIHMLNDRITSLSLDSTRKKIINILLLEFGRQKSPYLILPYSRKKMAELVNIPRPSLSRELMKMKEDGLIDFYKNKFKILDIKKLENELK